jgi:CheY-like chemotaxis protein
MPHILIVEDDPSLQKMYAFSFQQAHFTTDIVDNADDAMQMVRGTKGGKPDIILLDIMIIGVSGLEFLKRLNLKHDYPLLKVIAFSNLDSKDVIAKIMAAGADRFYLKANTTPQQLVDAAKELLEGSPA